MLRVSIIYWVLNFITDTDTNSISFHYLQGLERSIRLYDVSHIPMGQMKGMS